MTFPFSRQGLRGRERVLERTLEIVPGATSWAILLGMALLAFRDPLLAAILIIAFELYWLLRLLYMTLFLVLSYVRLSLERDTDWMARLKDIEAMLVSQPDPAVRGGQGSAGTPRRRPAQWIGRRNFEALRRGGRPPLPAQAMVHLVILPIATESQAVYEPGIRSLVSQQFPSKQILVVLAVEARAPADVHAAAEAVQQRFRHHFLDFLIVRHPDGVPGEARVKGANATCAAKVAAAYFTERGIPFECVVVSCFDADTVVGPTYFACLTYHFMSCPQRSRASFQPIPVYHNNIWDVPGFARVLDVGASFFQLVEATSSETLVTFSSHSMSFQALVEADYWPVDMISDDSAIFWKSLIHYDGDYRVVPMYVTVSMDVAAAGSWRKTVLNVYRQKRRWAWGVENFPIVMRAFLRANDLPLARRVRHGFKLFGGHVAWATWPFLIGVIGWLPALVAGREFSSSVVYYSAPRIAAIIFRLALISLLTTVVLSACLLPKPPVRFPWLKKLGHMVEWLFVPAVAIVLSAVPALDAQTRLMTGRYLEFWVTEKTRGGIMKERMVPA